MKMFISVILFTVSVIFFSCSKNCELTISACQDKVPDNEDCLAYFERWIYEERKNNCELISYSGCTQVGFATEQACNECKCR